MEKKTLAIILIVLLIFLCACPGLCIFLWGILLAAGGSLANLGIEGFEATGNPVGIGIGSIIAGFIMIVIAIVGIIYANKMKKEEDLAETDDVPPAI